MNTNNEKKTSVDWGSLLQQASVPKAVADFFLKLLHGSPT